MRRALIACNGLTAAPGELCFSCSLTRTRPATGDDEGLERFAKAETAKRRLLLELLELGLPVVGATERPGGLAFDLLDAWLPLTYALNALNRSMGADDLYPFVLAPPAIDKLAFIDELVRAARAAG